MKKAFDQNVSRNKPRVRLGAGEADAFAAALANGAASTPADALSTEVKVRIERSARLEETAAEPIPGAVETASVDAALREVAAARPALRQANAAPSGISQPAKPAKPPAPAKRNGAELTAEARRERLKERLKAAREDPRPEPLPATVAEAGTLAVERISFLQAELAKVKTQNLALTKDLESARRQSEKATEEARVRMDEAHRLAAETDARTKLLADLERELASLEGERNEALLALQEARQAIEDACKEQEKLQSEVADRDKALADSLAEEERLAGELEAARDNAENLRRSLDALNLEREMLTRQVTDLTAERAELLEARKALESVHRALSQATVR